MGCPGIESLPRRRQLHGSRLPGGEICPRRRAQFSAGGKVDLDSNGTESLLGRVFHRPYEGTGLGIERQDQSRPPANHVPSLCRPDIYARLFSPFIMPAFTPMLSTLPAFSMLATLSSLPTLAMFATAL